MTVKMNAVSHVISASYIHYSTHTEVPQEGSAFSRSALETSHLSSVNVRLQVKKDPDSPEATPPSTPGSSHSSKPLLQGNGSMDSRARQRKRKKVSHFSPRWLYVPFLQK